MTTLHRRALLALLIVACPLSLSAESRVAAGVKEEVKRYTRDAKEIAIAPVHWDRARWVHFAEGSGAVLALYVADRHLYDEAQRHRSGFTDDFAKAVTPFGGQRAEYVSAALIAGGLWTRDANLRDAGRDSLEAEILAGGIVTPLLKRAFGRARPSQGEGARSFHPFSSGHESFPSGHATNAFAAATAIAAHSDGWLVPAIAYTLASGVAVSRVNDRAHFPSDVLAGALIGRGIAKAVVYCHRRGGSSWMVMPAMIEGRPAVMVRLVTR
jgi:membrane-associated phospholipid phosphatase